jgi:DNA segregation ATPase FtsK/SpoIIIE-like protein
VRSILSAYGAPLKILIGVTVDGALHTADLSDSQSPHLLVVGSAGSGKSEWLRAFLASLMLRNSPATLRFALLDPKHLAFSSFENSPYLWKPVVHDSNLPARVALAMPRATDSRLVLGEGGAETLLGKGDLLYKDIGAPVRLQGLVVARETLLRLAGVTQ